MKSLPLAYILPYKRTRVRSLQLSIYHKPTLAAARANRLADSSSPTARASQAARMTLPASASAREPRYSWTCASTPCARPSCTSGARGSTSCRAPRAGLRGCRQADEPSTILSWQGPGIRFPAFNLALLYEIEHRGNIVSATECNIGRHTRPKSALRAFVLAHGLRVNQLVHTLCQTDGNPTTVAGPAF